MMLPESAEESEGSDVPANTEGESYSGYSYPPMYLCAISRIAAGTSFPHDNGRSNNGSNRYNTVSEGERRSASRALYPVTVSGHAKQEDAYGKKLLRTTYHAPRILVLRDQNH